MALGDPLLPCIPSMDISFLFLSIFQLSLCRAADVFFLPLAPIKS
jgi:hypothetical protein